jgi:hypothetical protein
MTSNRIRKTCLGRQQEMIEEISRKGLRYEYADPSSISWRPMCHTGDVKLRNISILHVAAASER